MNITIERVANGWVVKPVVKFPPWEGVTREPSLECIFVFSDIEDLERGLADILAME